MKCFGCGQSGGSNQHSLLDLCSACWDSLTLHERCTRAEAVKMHAAMADILTRLQHMDMSRVETMQLAKAIEQLSRVTKPQADAWDSIESELVPLLRSLRQERGE